MTYLFVTLVIICLWHFIYEGILLPSIRLKLRFELYALRDGLRDLKINENHKFKDSEFDHLHDIINGMLEVLPVLNINFVRRMIRAEESDPDLKDVIEQRRRAIESCSIGGVREIYHELSVLMNYAVFANSFCMLIYLIPVFLIQNVFLHAKRSIDRLTLTPVDTLHQLASPSKFFGSEAPD
ncbi:hypothetical protein [Chryseolinea soli]|uniref:Uncharacterized protein n=1 Tax=Chryseolinea soli TaxID=2321403 RepID=A0A385SW90_9BACT|nr:hypothetical protein [Chryseolinea soli]AYB34816.1 hypothetical protein D4L85_31420 [Chryseolinea soli]